MRTNRARAGRGGASQKRALGWGVIWICAGMMAAGLTGAGCDRGGEKAGGAKAVEGGAALPAVGVRVARVEARTLPVSEEVVGTIRSRMRAQLEAKASGRILKMPAVLGGRVDTGQVLVELDVGELRARVDQARAAMEQAGKEVARYRPLLEAMAVTRQEFDVVETRFRVAEASYREAEVLLGYAEVRAPFAGVISKRLAEVGDLASPGKALLEMEAPGALRVELDVGEALMERVKVGQKMGVRVTSRAGVLEGVVVEVSPAADPASRTFLVKLDLPEAEGVRAGAFARATISVGESRSLWAPASAVVHRGQMESMFVVVADKAELRLVRTGRLEGAEVEILSGVDAGEVVVAGGGEKLRSGQSLRVEP